MHTSCDYTSKLGFICEVVRVKTFKCNTVRRLLLLIGFVLTATGLLVLMDSSEIPENQNTQAVIFTLVLLVLTALIAAFVGRKTIKKRTEISKIEKDYKTFKINDENDKLNVVKLSEQKNNHKDLSNNINLLNKKLDKLKKEALKLGNDFS